MIKEVNLVSYLKKRGFKYKKTPYGNKYEKSIKHYFLGEMHIYWYADDTKLNMCVGIHIIKQELLSIKSIDSFLEFSKYKPVSRVLK